MPCGGRFGYANAADLPVEEYGTSRLEKTREGVFAKEARDGGVKCQDSYRIKSESYRFLKTAFSTLQDKSKEFRFFRRICG